MGAHTFWLSLVTSYICQYYTQVRFRCKTSVPWERLFMTWRGQLLNELNPPRSSHWPRYDVFKTRFISSSFCWFARAEQTPSLGGLGVYEKADPSCLCSKWEADDTDSHKMETPLGRQTLHCDNCYLITAGKVPAWFCFFFILCQHFGKANISVTTLLAL